MMHIFLVHQLQKINPSIKKVQDAKTKLVLHVTKEDVKKSKRKDFNNCAIAIACLKGNGKVPDGVIASRSRLYVINNGIATRYMIPNNAVRELTSFDRGASFTPGRYVMVPLPKRQHLGVKSTPYHGSGSHNSSPIHRPLINNIRITINENT